jgi:hypothetical protein
VPADWTLSAAGTGGISGPGPQVGPSAVKANVAYALSESVVAGYTNGGFVCVGGNQVGQSVTLDEGASAVCTITNDDQTAHLKLVKVVVNDNGGTKTATDWTLSASGPTPISGAGGVESDVNAGTYTLSENPAPNTAGYASTGYDCGASVTLALGESKTCTIINDDIPGTIIIVKNSKGGIGTFTFSIAGPSPSFPIISTTGTPNGTGTTGSITVDAGSYAVAETGLPANWKLTGSSCDAGSGTDTDLDGVVDTWNFTVPNGGVVTCTFEDTAPTATRTQGFWATHPVLASLVWAAAPASLRDFTAYGCAAGSTANSIGTATLANGINAKLMGGFWANVAKKTTGAHRSSVDKARMVLMQQLLAAILNVQEFGADDGGAIAAAKTAYCSGNTNAIKVSTGALTAFNESGDSGVFTPGVAADPKGARAAADLLFWDILP